MKPLLAIARLTVREGIRMRIVLVSLILLVLLVLYMPFALRGDETLAGRLQNFLAYSLGALSLLLSLATIFLSCSTLTTELKECSLHLVVTKPVTRFQILAGKWLGVCGLNLLIVVLCGAAIYGFATFLRTRPEQFRRDRLKVRDVVWTARYAARPVVPPGLHEQARADVRGRVERGELEPGLEAGQVKARVDELLRRWRAVDSGDVRVYEFRDLAPPEREDTVIQVRFKAIATPLPADELVTLGWVFLDPQTGAPLHEPTYTTERSGGRHQFLVTAASVIRDGQAALMVLNPYDPQNLTTVLFEGADSLQVLYKVASFESNFLKTLGFIGLRLALLSALGLFFGVFVSFPVACLCSAAFYLVCLGMPFWLESIGANLEVVMPAADPYGAWGPYVRAVLVTLLRGLFPDFTKYDGAGLLIEGEYVSYALLGWGLLRLLGYGLLVLGAGWLIFRAREVAGITV